MSGDIGPPGTICGMASTGLPADSAAFKQCAFCAEQIRFEAIVCRWCTRPVLVEARRLASIGQWYTIGRAADEAWSIWNVVTGGAAVKRFDATDEGWRKAFGEFRKLERPPTNVTWFIGGFVPLDFG
jgi:hypothetical protein